MCSGGFSFLSLEVIFLMKYVVRHSLPGRLRIGYDKHEVNDHQAALAQSLISIQEGIRHVTFNTVSSSFLIIYDPEVTNETEVKALFAALTDKYLNDPDMLQAVPRPQKQTSLIGTLASMTANFYLKKLLPMPVRYILRIRNLTPRIMMGVDCLAHGTISDTRVLDAAAIVISLATGETSTADNINFLLNIGETVEDYTRKKSYDNLATTMLSENQPVQVYVDENTEKTVPLCMLSVGDVVIVRTGAMIPADGEVISGEALVNQATITGEPLAVEKREGSSVFAGTVVQEGEVYIRCRSLGSQTKVNNILAQIATSQELKVSTQIRSENLANKLVKYNFMLTALTWLFTGNMTKVVSTLMVDYSCAMKLIAPVAVLSAMKEAAESGILVKGGKFLEDAAKADTVVFDKTGTLTQATPQLSRIIKFAKQDEDTLLKQAACLEEHFAHPIAKAIVQAAEERGLDHPEDHAKVEYIVAHGIASAIDGKRVLVGSKHFIFEDEKVPQPKKLEALQKEAIENGESLLYLAEDGILIGVFAVKDPIRKDARQIIGRLRRTGITSCNMITGDDEGAAHTVAAEAGLDAYISRALPEDKVKFIKSKQAAGHKVIMIGDGINDAPALAAADTGVAMGDSAAITGETADIVLSEADGLEGVVKARILGQRLLERIDTGNAEIIAFNSALIILGLFGIIPPATSALLHNTSTVIFSMRASQPLLEEDR